MKSNRPKQPTSQELLDSILDFLQRKFYEGDPISFRKDRSRLLAWVALWPASWLNKKGVSLPADRYREIFFQVFLEAKANGTEKITYRPAWLRHVIQTHFAHHGDEIYEQAKSVRNLVEHAVLIAGKAAPSAPDPVRELAQASTLLKARKPAPKRAVKDQLTLL